VHTARSRFEGDIAMSQTPAVRSTIDGPVLTVTLSRPAQRNAVDGPTATLLREAFEAF